LIELFICKKELKYYDNFSKYLIHLENQEIFIENFQQNNIDHLGFISLFINNIFHILWKFVV
jgi:hypothetical protein